MHEKQILADKKLSITTSRTRILNILLNSKEALSEKEIRGKLNDLHDRATIYRSLKIFTEKGIVHPVVTENLVMKYVIRKEPENHLHFKCTACGKVICMTGIRISSYSLPEGFVQYDSNFLVTGLCRTCNAQA